jgi:hypothetical protein
MLCGGHQMVKNYWNLQWFVCIWIEITGQNHLKGLPKEISYFCQWKIVSTFFGLRKEGAMIGKFAQITSMWPFLSTSSSCMVGSSQAWFVTYKAFSCLVRNATGRTAAYIYRLTFHEYSVELDHSGYWILDLWHLYLHFTHHLVSQELAWYFQAASLCILHHFVAPMWAQSNKCTVLT